MCVCVCEANLEKLTGKNCDTSCTIPDLVILNKRYIWRGREEGEGEEERERGEGGGREGEREGGRERGGRDGRR